MTVDFGGSPVATIGWDPEIFAEVDGKILPAFEFLPNRHEPVLFGAQRICSPTGNAYVDSHQTAYWDGFQAEFTTVPRSCQAYGFDNLRRGLEAVHKAATTHNKKAKLTLKNVFQFTPEELFQYDMDQVALGCDPSENAYGTNPFMVDNPFELPYRMAGGHIHFGIDRSYIKPGTRTHADRMAKALDFLIGIPSVGMFEKIDDPVRRQFYGRAGEYRLPKHGLEYRTLSNAWMGHPAVGHVLMDLGRRALGNFQKRLNLADFGTTEDYVKDVINHSDADAARKLFRANEDVWNQALVCCYPPLERRYHKSFSRLVELGVEELIPTYRDIDKNWFITDGRWTDHSNQEANCHFQAWAKTV